MSFNVEDVRKIIEESCLQIQNVAQNAVRHVSMSARWIYWKKAAFVVAIVVMVTMMSGLYVNDEWPWEMHTKVVQERNLAQAVLTTCLNSA